MLKFVIAICLIGAIYAADAYGAEEPAPAPHQDVPGAYPYGGYPYGQHYGGFPYGYGGFPYGAHPYYGYGGFPYYGYNYAAPYYHAPRPAPVGPGFQGYTYIGPFKGTCHLAADGIYYVDDRSFAFCSNGIKTVQACAEGSVNPDIGKFHPGKYHYADFCSINLSAQ